MIPADVTLPGESISGAPGLRSRVDAELRDRLGLKSLLGILLLAPGTPFRLLVILRIEAQEDSATALSYCGTHINFHEHV
ncbi:hypothetical protein AVEN_7070-1 [Araneus ventricosus]|uniref:Uncharacterized protein n=1 Tax=Araneus ventricosus TaxID=182803 RepID=A0A4Y2RCJ7_ARAVE|nr:hypothetical protein AVEN_7070-1 [Araneus ventricosus]